MLQVNENIHPRPQKQQPKLMLPHSTWGDDDQTKTKDLSLTMKPLTNDLVKDLP